MIKIHTHKFENDLYARLDSDLVQTYGCYESESGKVDREVVTPWVSTVDTSLYRCTCGKKIESDGHTATAICYDCMIFWELDSLWMSHLFLAEDTDSNLGLCLGRLYLKRQMQGKVSTDRNRVAPFRCSVNRGRN